MTAPKAHFSDTPSAEAHYLVIAGTTKSASTSLHVYLQDHPQVTALLFKESGYWLDVDYPSLIGDRERYTSASLSYTDYFPAGATTPFRLDVTPDYMYSAGTAQRLHQHLPQSSIYFALREPISRLISKYRYLHQQERLPKGLSIDAYVDELLAQPSPLPYDIKQPYRTLDQGRYGDYVQPFLDHFGPDRLGVLYFEELTQAPKAVMQAFCAREGLDPAFYDDYPFPVVNPTRTIHSKKLERGYHGLRKRLSALTEPLPGVHRAGVKIKEVVQPLVYRLNGNKKDHGVHLSADRWYRLRDYYHPQVVQLHQSFPVPEHWRKLYELQGPAA